MKDFVRLSPLHAIDLLHVTLSVYLPTKNWLEDCVTLLVTYSIQIQPIKG